MSEFLKTLPNGQWQVHTEDTHDPNTGEPHPETKIKRYQGGDPRHAAPHSEHYRGYKLKNPEVIANPKTGKVATWTSGKSVKKAEIKVDKNGQWQLIKMNDENRINSSLYRAEHKDKIQGGKGDKKEPKDFDEAQLKEGIRIEMEHTDDATLAQEIAMDHLTEDKDYYRKLKTIHKD